MRKALNENPIVQMAILGVFAVAFAILLYTTVLSGDEPPPASDQEVAVAGETATPGAAALTDPAASEAAAGEAAAPSTEAAPPATGAPPAAGQAQPIPAGDLVPSAGLPENVLVALAKGKAVALIVYDPKADLDEKVKAITNQLSGRDDVEVIDVRVGKIAKYSRITQGVDVTRTPALVVVSPRGNRGPLTAVVAYGFRGKKSVETALEGALYKGGERTYAP